MKYLLARLALGLLGLLFALLLAEAALRVLPLPDLRVLAGSFQAPPAAAWKDPAWGDPPDRAFRRHRVIGHEHAPSVDLMVPLAEHPGGAFHFQTNERGLRRDVETDEDKPADLFRVLVLGDSQTDGYVDNEASFSSLLERDLGERLAPLGQRVEVLNGGVAGYSPAQIFLWHSFHGAELKPDLVIVVFYTGNDVLDLLDPGKPNVDPTDGRVIRPRQADEQSEQASGLLEQSRLGLVARYAVQAGPLAPLWRQLSLPGRLTEAGGFSTDTLVQVFRTCHGCYLQSLQQAVRARRDPVATDQALERAGGILTRLDQEVRANGGRLLVAVLPTRAQVEPALAREQQRAAAGLLGLNEADLAYEQEVGRAIEARLGAAGVPTLPLGEALGAAAGSEALYYSRDWHLNRRGHQAAAQGLAGGLEALGLLPAR
jgi:lysophospholipase L1-like esterase